MNTNQWLMGDGFLAFQFVVQVKSDNPSGKHFKLIVDKMKALKSFVRENQSAGISPDQMIEAIHNAHPSADVVAEGAYSSIAIPLFMYHSLTTQSARLSGVLGAGPIADATLESVRSHGVEFVGKVISDGDSPIELSIRDEFGNHKTIRLYPASRTKYRQTLKLSPVELNQTAGFILTRYNKSRDNAFRRISEAGGFTSLRIAEPSRYVSLADYAELLPYSSQVIVSHRSKVLQLLAKHFRLNQSSNKTGCDWTRRFDEDTARLLACMRSQVPPTSLVILVLEDEVVISPSNGELFRCVAPDTYDHRSRAARIQGAAAAMASPLNGQSTITNSWRHMANWIVQAAYSGTEGRPSTYPDRTFAPSGDWLVGG